MVALGSWNTEDYCIGTTASRICDNSGNISFLRLRLRTVLYREVSHLTVVLATVQ